LRITGLLVFAIGALVVPASATATENESAAADVPTFNADVAPILYENCASCHRKGQVAPMPLTSYPETRPWARSIKAKVVAREMPPWFADPRYGHFKDPLTLSEAEIDTIAAWADGGAPQGDGPAPDAPVFTSEWQHDRPPDYVVEMPVELELPAQGEVEYVEVWMENPFEEDVFLEAVQVRPKNYGVTHHGGIFNRTLPPGTYLGDAPLYPGGQMIPQPIAIDPHEDPGAKRARAEAIANGLIDRDSQLIFYRPGGGYNRFPEGTGKRLYAERHLMFQMHYSLTGRPEIARPAAGFWFSKERPHHQVLTVGLASAGTGKVRIVENTEQLGFGALFAHTPPIPPHADDFRVTGIWPVTDDVTIYGMWPHMHFRGKGMTSVVSYPDGTEETILSVPNYDFNWQIEYDFVEPLKVPAGSTIKTIGHYDNSVKNRYNPSPDQEVQWGEQSWDEMFAIFTKFSVDKDDISLEN
jgi:mono/diheme cytochrome c family protein